MTTKKELEDLKYKTPTISREKIEAYMHVLNKHKGKNNRISHDDLIEELKKYDVRVTYRTSRSYISQLRKKGYLIASTPGNKGGLYIPVTRQEYEEYANRIFRSRISDLETSLSAQNVTANLTFGPQLKLEM
jgi:predicted transcriptional regulator